MARKRAAVIGATGIAGQQFLAALADHPLFEVTALAASERSAGKAYRDAITDASGAFRWYCAEPLAPAFAGLMVQDAAKELEPRFAKTTPVISTASAFRYEDDVPVFIPGVNLDHDRLIAGQKRRRGWTGFITPVPNCTTMGLAMTLKPLHDAFGIRQVIMTSLQSVSGAGRSPGVLTLDILDNVVPYIPKEEEKVEAEARKILGVVDGDTVRPAAFRVSATCTRVPVLEGHTETVNVSLERAAAVDDVKRALREHGREFLALGLHSAPSALIDVSEDPFRPQPRLDRDREHGMLTSVGRVRVDPALPNGIKYVLVSHNTKMGAARGALLVAEYLAHRGQI